MLTESQFMAGVINTVEAMEIGKVYVIDSVVMERTNKLRREKRWGNISSPQIVRVSERSITVNNTNVEIGNDVLALTFAITLALSLAFTLSLALPLAFGKLTDIDGEPLMVLPEEDLWYLECQRMNGNINGG